MYQFKFHKLKKLSLISTIGLFLGFLSSCDQAPPSVEPKGKGEAQTATNAPSPALESVKKANRIGLLLPLTGAEADKGKHYLNAAHMGLFNTNDNMIEILPVDTQSTMEGTVKALQSAMKQGVNVIIGAEEPLNLNAIANTLSNPGVPIISLAQTNPSKRKHTYIMGIPVVDKVERLLHFARKVKIHTISIVCYSHDYENDIRKVTHALSEGMGLAIQVYGYNSISKDIPKIIESFAKLPPDGILVVGPLSDMRSITQIFKDTETKAQIMVTGDWSVSELPQEKVFNRVWMVDQHQKNMQWFKETYQKHFNSIAPKNAAMIFDAISLVSLVAKDGLLFDSNAFRPLNGFNGVGGTFHFDEGGHAQYHLNIFEFFNKSLRVMDTLAD